MERKDFLRNSLGLIGISAVMADACKKEATQTANTALEEDFLKPANAEEFATSCIISPTETEGPYPYPSGEIKNPLNRSDIREDQTGIALVHQFTVVNTNASCAVVQGARVDIWHCNKDGYYSGYANQPGYLGTKSYVGSTWLRGYQLTDANGQVTFTTVFPGWYNGRATHIHLEVYVNNVLKKTTQIAFTDTVTKQVYATKLYNAHGNNTTTNSGDNVFGDSAADLANEITNITKGKNQLLGYFTLGIAL